MGQIAGRLADTKVKHCSKVRFLQSGRNKNHSMSQSLVERLPFMSQYVTTCISLIKLQMAHQVGDDAGGAPGNAWMKSVALPWMFSVVF